ncbi:hypothetical protein DU258_06260 [Salmonella enterica subsp. enterica]|uniref:Uncharacterized protein n=1 Tax=Salmonella enterica subsp. enterica serovar Macclesfield str. S-1643 TaxID=1242107 RepID=A0A2C9NWI4_SALET|nr:hypothetical protein [Salmonella enterica]EAA5484612.1 hypothetical protein [Salmonella enterica subsp. enterica serovar Kouka]EBG2393155.1 hypothetical protein [Salmonella enterica subsp. enterica serovar Everleigh]EBV2190871.1 hypothetical protein [Salmonella enterica subsp. enterica serovar Afula]ECH9426832.1 hypothetical protein [Salmonella enterica subsp. enterica]ASG15061.1 hypothetical protein LFZ25_03305 [Salmonella enterica subsp. enterica serovar Macclesfield str. S-1643]
MAVYVVSNNLYLQEGMTALIRSTGTEVIKADIHSLPFDLLSFEDIIILHLSPDSKNCAKIISSLNRLTKLMVIQTSMNLLCCHADLIINAKDSLFNLKQATLNLLKTIKSKVNNGPLLSHIENIVINYALAGKSVNAIAHILKLPPKRVYDYRSRACKKLGGKKIHDLLLIQEIFN